jgi:ubiquinone biosynthesis protein UbiJ
MNWRKEDILEVLSWVEESRDDINAITTELEYIVVSELFKRCADEIRALRVENDRLKNRRKKRESRKQNGVH